MAVTSFPEAIRRAVKSFYEGSSFESYEKTTKQPLKYNNDMFDELQSSYKRRNKRSKKKSDKEEIEVDVEEDDIDG
jgi:hypothetical protein